VAKQSAADYLENVDPGVRIILAELTENSGLVARAWATSLMAVRSDPERALESLVEAEIHLNLHIRLELRDTLRAVRAAIALLDQELPD
jgi:hypothetical protein